MKSYKFEIGDETRMIGSRPVADDYWNRPVKITSREHSGDDNLYHFKMLDMENQPILSGYEDYLIPILRMNRNGANI